MEEKKKKYNVSDHIIECSINNENDGANKFIVFSYGPLPSFCMNVGIYYPDIHKLSKPGMIDPHFLYMNFSLSSVQQLIKGLQEIEAKMIKHEKEYTTETFDQVK